MFKLLRSGLICKGSGSDAFSIKSFEAAVLNLFWARLRGRGDEFAVEATTPNQGLYMTQASPGLPP